MYDMIKAIRGLNAKPGRSFPTVGQPTLPEKSSITAGSLNEIFGTQGEVKDGMMKFTIGRPAKMHGVTIEKDMGCEYVGCVCPAPTTTPLWMEISR